MFLNDYKAKFCPKLAALAGSTTVCSVSELFKYYSKYFMLGQYHQLELMNSIRVSLKSADLKQRENFHAIKFNLMNIFNICHWTTRKLILKIKRCAQISFKQNLFSSQHTLIKILEKYYSLMDQKLKG